ncbi:hypothetical protein MKW98_014587 [Papaver atlanticum]|uniref:ADP-ribosylation factor n=1 Tax=Papaver atlanticum TaxID=357466 RepID=A0AAD4SH64_9MAGN|nr:hypothetical protein MKW98_014587 [Papaver atlanticum]
MGQAFRKLFDTFFGNSEMRVVMLGLDAAGKTTILYKLHIGEVLSTVPTIGFNVEKVQYKNVIFTVWDVGGQEKLRPLWRHYFSNTDGLIYVVDSLDRERIGKAKAEFQAIIKDPFMLNSVILVFANKQDMKGAMTPMEVNAERVKSSWIFCYIGHLILLNSPGSNFQRSSKVNYHMTH